MRIVESHKVGRHIAAYVSKAPMDKPTVKAGRDRSGFIRESMIQISHSASTTRDLAGLFHLIDRQFSSLLAAENFFITIQNSSQNSTRFLYGHNQYLPDPASLVGYGETILAVTELNHTDARRKDQNDSLGKLKITEIEKKIPGAWLDAPFSISNEKLKGHLLIHSSSRSEPFSEDERALVQLVASQTAMAIYRNKAELWRDLNERNFQGILSSAPMGMHLYTTGPANRLTLAGYNPAADQVLQIDHSFLMGKSIDEVLTDLSETEVPEQFRKLAREGGTYHSEQAIYEQGQIYKAYQIHAFQTAPGKIAAMFVEIGEHKRTEESLRMRDGILSAAVFTAEQFLENHDWSEKIQIVLERLGEVTGSSRVFLAENKTGLEGEIRTIQRYEWRISSLAANAGSPWTGEFSFMESGFHHWTEAMQNGEVIHRLTGNLPHEQAVILQQYEIRSIAAAPILIDKEWWGLIGFENHIHERVFSREVIEAIRLVAHTIGAAIQHAIKESSLFEKASRTDALVKTAARLNTRLEPESVIDTVCIEAAQSIRAQSVSIYLYNEESQALHCAGGINLIEDCFNAFEPIPLQTLNHFLGLNGAPILLRDPEAIQRFFHAPVHETLHSSNIISLVFLFDQKLIGILNIYLEDAQRILTAEELEYLEGLTHEAALAINNARLLLAEKIRSKELATLYDLSVNLNKSLSVEESLEISLSSVQDLLEADAGMIILHDTSKSTLSVPFATGYLAANTGHVFGWQENKELYSEASARTETTTDISTRFGLFSGLKGIKLCAAATTIPLISGNEAVGILVVTRKKNGEPKSLSPFDQRLLQAIGELAGTTIRKAQFYEDGQRRLTFLQSLRTIDIEISTNLELDSTLSVVLDEVLANLQVDAVAVLVIDPSKGKLKFGTQKGFMDKALYKDYLERGESYAELAAFDRRMFILPDIRSKQTNFTNSQLFQTEIFIAYAAVPLLAKGQVRGVLEVFGKRPFSAHQEWLEFLETLAGQTAIAIEHTSLFENLQKTNADLLNAYDVTIEGWSTALDLKDSDTEGHTRRVAEMTERLAIALGVPEKELIHLRRGALLHDIGKMGVPDNILRKPGPLTEEEWAVMKKHPVYAYEWLSPAEYLRPALDIPFSHHEKWDGTGYPLGLKGTEIPFKARIFSLVDVWDALSSDRPYRKRWPREDVVNYIREQSSAYFDPEIVPIFLELIKDQESIH
jgi:HD-GYP domain-containing protein (c-di-GMP phosphodiesterase class II)